MKWLKASVFAMVTIAIALITGSVAGINRFYRHPIFLGLVLVLLVIQVICLVKYSAKFSLKKIGFYICHLAVILLAIGAIASTLLTQSVNFVIPVGEHTTYRKLEMTDGNVVDLGFSVAITDFNVTTYENSSEVKQYKANFRVYDKTETYEQAISVNNPAAYKNWKFYMMGYKIDTVSYVSIYAKNDPGNIYLLIGFIALDIGTALLCFLSALKKRG